MGEVWAAHDTELDRLVALKFLSCEAVFGGGTRRAMEPATREARAASALNHPNIVTVHEVIRHEEAPIIVMEFIDGTSLRELSGTPQPMHRVLDYGLQVARALATAHAHGIVHRDVKPENILVRRDGYVKVLDFGLALCAADEGLASTAGLGGGTLRYMSPEQARGELVSYDSDIFSFGLVLYELATGRHAFAGGSASETLHRMLTEEPAPPSSVNPLVTSALNSLILAMLAKDATARPSAEEIVRTLEALQPGSTTPRTRHSKKLIATLVAAGLLLLALTVFRLNGLHARAIGTVHPNIESVAVLPMENLARDPEQEYFVDGMTDQLITNLVQSTPLRVISRTSVMQYKGVHKPLRDIARALNVDAVVEGSVVRHGGKVKIQAQLLDARNDRYLWAETYERDQSDLWAMQDEISSDIANRVAVNLRPGNKQNRRHDRPVSAAAYEDYLRGRYFWAKRTPIGLAKAAEYFQMAIDAEPQYALAYVGLADTYNVISFYDGGPSPSESFPKAEAAARKALSIDDTLGEAHAALADNLFSYHWDWSGGEREFRRAIQLNSGYAPAHHWYSELLSVLGRNNEAIAEIKQARQLDPLSLAINETFGGALYLARRYDDAALQIKKTIDFDPSYAPAHNMLGWIYTKKGMYSAAITEFERAVDLSDHSPADVAALGWGYAEAGKQREARRIGAMLEANSLTRYVSPEALGRLYAAAGEKKLAMERLERSLQHASCNSQQHQR